MRKRLVPFVVSPSATGRMWDTANLSLPVAKQSAFDVLDNKTIEELFTTISRSNNEPSGVGKQIAAGDEVHGLAANTEDAVGSDVGRGAFQPVGHIVHVHKSKLAGLALVNLASLYRMKENFEVHSPSQSVGNVGSSPPQLAGPQPPLSFISTFRPQWMTGLDMQTGLRPN